MTSTHRWIDLVGLPSAIQFESPSSWLSRAALSQGVTVLELLDHVGWRPAGDFDLMFSLLYRDGLPPELPMWAGLEVARRVLVGHQLVGCRPEGLLVADLRRRGRSSFGLYLLGGKRARYRFCPLCLDADFTPFVRQEWRFDCWRYCPVHGCLLCDRCSRCGRAVELPASLVRAGPAKASAGELPMSEPSGRGVLRIGVEAAVSQDLRGEAADTETIIGLAHDTAGQGPMPNRCDHVLADAERSDGVLVGESGLVDQAAIDRLVEGLLEPHLSQREGLVTREMDRGLSICVVSRSHLHILAELVGVTSSSLP